MHKAWADLLYSKNNSPAFVDSGFSDWKKGPEKFKSHESNLTHRKEVMKPAIHKDLDKSVGVEPNSSITIIHVLKSSDVWPVVLKWTATGLAWRF